MGKLTPSHAALPPASLRRSSSAGVAPASWPSSRLPSAILALLVVPALLLASFAQSSPLPTNPKPPAKDPPAGKNAATTPKDSDPTGTPSRYIAEENVASYVTALAAKFSMRGRATDPFGQLQDPEAKRIIKTPVTKTSHRAAPVQATPFAEIVRIIKVTTIMPKEQRFLIGTRVIQQGDHIPLNYHGKSLRVEVAAVTSHQIEFRNLDNNETATLKLDLLPAGMTPGTRLFTAPGMVPDRPDSPIDLDAGSPPNDKSPTR